MVKAIIFDMDGVLFDTEPYYFERRKRFLDSQGISISHMSPKDFIGGNLQQVWHQLLGEHFQAAQVQAISDDYEEFKKNNPVPYTELLFPKIKETLQQLTEKNIKLALASNSSPSDVQRAIASCQLKDYFDYVLTAKDVDNPKPAPDIYLKVGHLLGLPKNEIWVIEDSQKGISAAKEAGYQVYGIKDYRYGIDQDQADHIIDNISELISLITDK